MLLQLVRTQTSVRQKAFRTTYESGCKVYPLSPSEQKELDAFIQENLESGHICPSKSPMASPVFFIKKKDGALRLVQD